MMTDLNPSIWSNPTLGEAGNGNFLDVVTAQIREDKSAALEGRAARTATPNAKWPIFPPNPITAYNDKGYTFS